MSVVGGALLCDHESTVVVQTLPPEAEEGAVEVEPDPARQAEVVMEMWPTSCMHKGGKKVLGVAAERKRKHRNVGSLDAPTDWSSLQRRDGRSGPALKRRQRGPAQPL